MKLILSAVLAAIFLSGCATTKALAPGASSVRVSNVRPPPVCRRVASVDNQGQFSWAGITERGLRNVLKNQAFEKGANYVRVEQLRSDGTARGTAFRCPAG